MTEQRQNIDEEKPEWKNGGVDMSEQENMLNAMKTALTAMQANLEDKRAGLQKQLLRVNNQRNKNQQKK